MARGIGLVPAIPCGDSRLVVGERCLEEGERPVTLDAVIGVGFQMLAPQDADGHEGCNQQRYRTKQLLVWHSSGHRGSHGGRPKPGVEGAGGHRGSRVPRWGVG